MIRIIEMNVFDTDKEILAHQVNTEGIMGAGLAKEIKYRHPEVYEKYESCCKGMDIKELMGEVQLVNCTSSMYDRKYKHVANLFAESLRYKIEGERHTDYEALRESFKKLNSIGHSVAVPYLIGCGLGGGDWNVVKKIIEEECLDIDVDICSIDPLPDNERV